MKRLILLSIVQVFLVSFFTAHSSFAQSVEMQNGISYLYDSQNSTGSWGGVSAITEEILATTTVLETFSSLGETGSQAYQAGSSWLSGQTLDTTSHLSRRILANNTAGSDSAPLIALLDDMRKAWGGAEGYDVNVLDTALALKAVKQFDDPDLSTIGYTLSFLLSSQNSDGGWGFTENSTSDIYISATVSLALQQFQGIYNLATPIGNAKSYLLTHQNADGGFGSSSSTIHETALSLLVLTDSHLDTQVMANALLYLRTEQSSDGSWQQDPFNTALAVMALTAEEKAHQPPPPSSLIGAVVNALTGQPLAGVNVILSGAGNGSVSTLSDGSFVFRDLSAGDYSLQFGLGGYQAFGKSVSVATSEDVDLGSLSMVKIVVPVTAIKGTVTDAESGQPIADVSVNITGSTVSSAVTDQNGDYRIEGLNPGGIVIVVLREGYLAVSASATVKSNQTILFSLKLTTDIIVPPDTGDTAGLTGVVTDFETGQVLSGAEVTVSVASIMETVFTDVDGRFDFADMPSGVAYVSLTATGYIPMSFSVDLQSNLTVDVGSLKMRAEGSATFLPDLAIESIDMSSTFNDPRTLELSGLASVTVKNTGDGIANPYLGLLAFYDTNKNKLYDDGVDQILGQSSTSVALGPSESEVVGVSLFGTLPYRDAPVTFWIDSLESETEVDEGNNILSSVANCTSQIVNGTFEPIVKFHALDGTKVSTTPMVANLTDDNGDGLIDGKDIPDMAVVDHAGLLHVISGDDGRELFVTSPSYRTRLYNEIAIGDIDGDSLPELVVAHQNAQQLIAFEHTGELKWLSDVHPLPATVYLSGVVSIADLDSDGTPEIVVGGAVVFDSTGAFVADGRDLGGTAGYNFATAISSIADINLDGIPEIIAGPTAYQLSNGQLSILWQRAELADGFSGVGNFDDDDFAEIVIVGGGRIYMLNHDGTDAEVWNQPIPGYVNIPGGGHGGPPTIADMDGDGEPEIGVAGANNYVLFEKDGSVAWTAHTIDASSSITGSTSFDFEGDGTAEIIYRDEHNLHIFNGSDGAEIFTWSLGAGTGVEMPVIADIDNDGHAEIAVSSDSNITGLSEHTGVYVFEDANDSWMPTRTTWNQHSYHINNINDDASIPQHEEPSWLTHNTYRLNTFVDRNPLSQPDFSAATLRLTETGSGSLNLSVLIGNGGSGPASATMVSFYEGDPSSGGTLLGSSSVLAMEADSSQMVTLSGVSGITGLERIYAVVDPDNLIDECNEENNSVSIPAPGLKADLIIPSIDTSGITTDLMTLEVSGSMSVDVSNSGSLATFTLVDLLAYYDANNSSAYEAGVDVFLGEGRTTSTLDAGVSETVTVAISGVLPYRDAPVSVWVDNSEMIDESDETNNYFVGSNICRVETAPVGTFEPVLKWEWSGATADPSKNNVFGPAVVGQLDDDNGDGIVNSSDTPDLVFIGGNATASNQATVITAVSGSDGSELWSRNDIRLTHRGSAALGDIDNDGLLEIIAPSFFGDKLYAFENDGSLKWITPSSGPKYSSGVADGIAIADLNHDGSAEIIHGRRVFDNEGSLLWQGLNDHAGPTRWPRWGFLSIAADVDLAGAMEVIAGRTLYGSDGVAIWHRGDISKDGFNAVGNFDNDDFAEIVLVSGNKVYVLEHSGETKWVSVIPGSGEGGAPTVADFDGDGDAEIGVAAANYYSVFDTDGSVMWSAVTQDKSSAMTGSSVFDFEGDGKAEVVYADEVNFYILDGSTGDKLFQVHKTSMTTTEYPNVVDIDNDGHAEIIVPSNRYGGNPTSGVRVYESANDDWAPTRSIWNQHSYHITNINDDGTIPQNEEPSWLSHNTYRLNTFADRNPLDISDLSAAMLRVVDKGLGVFDLTARIGNGGTLALTQNITVSFYEGDPAAGGRLLGNVDLTGLSVNAFTDVTLEDVSGITGTADIFAAVDLANQVDECDESNNRVQVAPPQIWADLVASGLWITDNGSGNPLTAAFTISNIGALASPDQTLVAFYNGDPLAGGVLLGTMNIAPVNPGEELLVSFADLSGIDSGETPYVVADGDDRVREYSECNNIAELVLPASEQGVLALATDKPLYGANEEVSIIASVTNTSALSGEFAVRLRIEDSGGVLVQELQPVSTGTIPGGGVTAVNAFWNTGTYLAGGYQVRGYLDSSSASGLHETTTIFAIGEIDPQIPVASLRTTTDKIIYDPGETVVIHDLLSNESVNAIIGDSSMSVEVTDQNGAAVFTETLSVGQLVPGMRREFTSLFTLGVTPAGQYTVTGRVTLVGDATLLTEDTATFEVRGTAETGGGLTGCLNADDQVYMGRDLAIDYTVTNDGNEDINELTVKVVIIDPETDTLFQTLENVISIGQGMTYNGAFVADTTQLVPDVYMAVLIVFTPEMTGPKTFCSVNFEVLPSLEAEITRSDSINLLVWVNDGCGDRSDDEHDCDDHDSSDVSASDDHDDMKSGKDGDNNHDEDNRKDDSSSSRSDDDKDNDNDDHGKKECASLDLIESILSQITDYYLIVRERDDFERELRNPLFTDAMVLGDKHQLTDHHGDELREMAFSGTGLVASLWSQHGLGEEVFGLEIEGELPENHNTLRVVETVAGPITVVDTLSISGRVNRLDAVREEQVAGWIASDKCREKDDEHRDDSDIQGHDKKDGEDEDDEHGHRDKDTPGHCPAIVFNDFGEGGSVYLAFDLVSSLDLTTYDQFKDLLANALSYVHRQGANNLDPYRVVPFTTKLKSLGGAFDVRLTDTWSPELSLFDPVLGSWVLDSPRITDIFIDADQTLGIKTFALMPDQPGDYSIETEVGFVFGGEYSFFDSLYHEFTVSGTTIELIDTIIVDLDNSGLKKSRIRNAKKDLVKVQDRLIVSRHDIEKNIHDIEKIIDILIDDHDHDFDIAGIRLMLGRLLRIEQGRWYFHVQ